MKGLVYIIDIRPHFTFLYQSLQLENERNEVGCHFLVDCDLNSAFSYYFVR